MRKSAKTAIGRSTKDTNYSTTYSMMEISRLAIIRMHIRCDLKHDITGRLPTEPPNIRQLGYQTDTFGFPGVRVTKQLAIQELIACSNTHHTNIVFILSLRRFLCLYLQHILGLGFSGLSYGIAVVWIDMQLPLFLYLFSVGVGVISAISGSQSETI